MLCLVLLLLLLQYYDRAKARLRNKITWIIMAKKGPNCHRNASWILSVVILLIIEILTCIKLSVSGVIFDDLYTFWRQYTGHYETTHRWNNILISAGHKIVVPWPFSGSQRMLTHVASSDSLSAVLVYCFHNTKIIWLYGQIILFYSLFFRNCIPSMKNTLTL